MEGRGYVVSRYVIERTNKEKLREDGKIGQKKKEQGPPWEILANRGL